MNPAPWPYHQAVSARLLFELMRLVARPDLGRVFSAPIDVHLSPGTIVQPDLVVLHARRRSLIGATKITGVPDLLIEILSTGNRAYDVATKRDRYERSGVREYWLVDPDARTVTQLVLRRGRYVQVAVTADHVTPPRIPRRRHRPRRSLVTAHRAPTMPPCTSHSRRASC